MISHLADAEGAKAHIAWLVQWYGLSTMQVQLCEKSRVRETWLDCLTATPTGAYAMLRAYAYPLKEN